MRYPASGARPGIRDGEALMRALHDAHDALRDAVVTACEHESVDDLAAVVRPGGPDGDATFALDRVGEERLVELFAPIAASWPLILVAEGLSGGEEVVLPSGTDRRDAELIVIVDPIDGTRGLMYQKRSAWILTGVAVNRGGATSLADIELAVQTEIPTLKQHLSDRLWTRRGHGCQAARFDRLTRQWRPLRLRPSAATTVAQGFGGLARFIPGGREILAAIEDAVYERLLGPPGPGEAQAFEDQYISSGGQIYELVAGHDRWTADVRALLRHNGVWHGLCARPYDLCTELIAREAGVVVTDLTGAPLSAPLDTTTDVAWLGYCNKTIQAQVEPALRAELAERGLLRP